MGLRARLQECVRHLSKSASYSASTFLLILVTHSFLGWRRLRDIDYYRGDPLLKRFLGLERIPDVSTLSRRLVQMDERVVEGLRTLQRNLVIDRILDSCSSRITMDFDGSVISTKSRRTQGTAVGYNKKKGQRSYYPLFATIAQTGGLRCVASCWERPRLQRGAGLHSVVFRDAPRARLSRPIGGAARRRPLQRGDVRVAARRGHRVFSQRAV
ncbi:MAG: transposase [Planctomycetes bacterium]|nr:transposase [Planctomycetota bacterium]